MMRMYFDKPATEWEQTLPIGNGRLGGMIWGTVQDEKIGLNDDELWSGYPQFKGNEKSLSTLPDVRKAILSGDSPRAESLIRENMLGGYNESFLSLGNIHLKFSNIYGDNYRRELDIENSLVTVTYGEHKREYFASYPEKALYGRIHMSNSENALHISFESSLEHQLSLEKNGFLIQGRAPEHIDPIYIDSLNPIIQGERGMSFAYELLVQQTDGQVFRTSSGLTIENFKELTFVFREKRDKPTTDFETAKANHIADYHTLFNRVEIDLGKQIDLPMDERLNRLRQGESDPGLIALYFQYGRYLLISSSRTNTLAANLQGIWNWHERAPWSGNWTTNINAEMNYWGVDTCNLSECFNPFIALVKGVIENGRRTAKEYYGVAGSCCHHNVDKWYSTNPVGRQTNHPIGDKGSVTWSMWPMAGVWMTADLYRHYEYTADETYLAEIVYPLLRESTLFLTEFLTEVDGVFHTLPSTSPENSFYDDSGNICCVDKSVTMDICLIKENFDFFRKICTKLAITDDLLIRVDEIVDALPVIPIGSKGQVLEWQKEYSEVELGHRHFSHLYGAYPGELFDEKYRQATLRSLEIRSANGSGHTGWSNAWLINLYSVLGESEKAYQHIISGMAQASYDNLWSKHPPFQIDGNFGGIAGIANLFVQDRQDGVKLLPALPKALSSGYVKGLRIKGNKQVEIRWKFGEIIYSKIY